jgi:hypothetical protein
MNDRQLKSEAVDISSPPTVIHTTPIPRGHPSTHNALERLELANRLRIRLILCWFLVCTLTLSTLGFFGLTILKALRYEISETFLTWLGGATVTQVALLLGVFVRAVWRQDSEQSAK